MAFMSRAVETESQRFGGELAPEIIPLLSALEAKKLLIKGPGSANVFVLYITKSSARTGIAAGRDEILFFLMGRRCHRSLQFRHARRPAPQPIGKSFDRAR